MSYKGTSKLSRDEWEEIRASRSVGVGLSELSKKYGISQTMIVHKAREENWGSKPKEGLSDVIREMATERLIGLKDSDSSEKAERLLDLAVDRAANLLKTHQREWSDHRLKFGIPSEYEDARNAKITAEMLILRQKGERIAWGLDEGAAKPVIEIERVGVVKRPDFKPQEFKPELREFRLE